MLTIGGINVLKISLKGVLLNYWFNSHTRDLPIACKLESHKLVYITIKK